jgi:hypothetical protein
MTIEEAGRLLIIINEFIPSFNPTEGMAKNWQRVLGRRMTFVEAENYVYKHFESSRFAPMPADIIQRWREDFDPDKLPVVELPDDMRGAARE